MANQVVDVAKDLIGSETTNQVGKMKSGDYMIHVYISQGKTFRSEEGNATINPIIQIDCGGQTQYSSSKDDVACQSPAPVTWREHMFFEFQNRASNLISQDSITISVKNKGYLRDELVGSYQFDMTFVYFKEKHVIHNQWIALINQESENFNEIAGYLKVSISVQGPGDEQIQLGDDHGPKQVNQDAMIPAQIKKQFKQLKIRFIQGQKLPELDNWGTIDAYLYAEIYGKEIQTEAVTMEADICPIMQEWWLPLQWPLSSDKLLIKIYDQDVGRDELVGTLFFSLKKLVELGSKTGGYFYWQNVYGAPKNISGVSAEVTNMDENPECASAWMGRFLMHIECSEDKQPVRKVEKIAGDIKQKAIDLGFFKLNEYDFIADVGQGVCLPDYDTAYTVKIKVAEHEFTTKAPQEHKVGYNRWNQRIQQVFKTEYSQPETLDRVYVYLMSGEYPICWWKGRVTDFLDPNPEYKWLTMKNDKAYGYVAKEHEAGMIQIKMAFNPRNINGEVDFTRFEAFKRPPPRRLNNKIIRAFIYQMRNLPSADEDGSSDTFVEAWSPYPESENKNSKHQTAVIHDNNNPIFFEALELVYDLENLKNAPPVILNIWDTDYGSASKDNYIGRAVIKLFDAASNLSEENKDLDCNSVPRPKWHPIRIGFDEKSPIAGEILCSFIIADSDFNFKVPTLNFNLGQTVPQVDFIVEVNVMGLRELESFGLMPIRKPYINLRAKSLLPPDKHDAINNVKTDPVASGPNPNINNTLAFNVTLPTDNLFCPSLACDVYDYIYLGMSQPLIGTFILDIGDVMKQQKAKRDLEKKQFIEVIDYLNEKASITAEDHNIAYKKRLTSQLSGTARDHLKSQTKKIKENQEKQKQRRSIVEEQKSQIIGDDIQKPGAKYDTYGAQNTTIQDQETEDIEKLIATERKNTQGFFGSFFGGEEEDLNANVKKEQEQFEKALNDIIEFQKSHSKKLSLAEKTALSHLKIVMLEQKEVYMKAVKKAKQEKIEADNALLAMLGKWTGSACMNVLIPNYRFDQQLNFYVEEDVPPETLYRSVGYNNLQTVRDLMEGDEHSRKEKKLTEEEGRERLMAGSNKHYRKFYEDELENDKKLFPQTPFLKVPVMRGQSRGLQKSWFSWGSDSVEDESGELSNEKQVGYFKGKVRVFNNAEEKKHDREKKNDIKTVFDLISKVHQTIMNKPLELDIDSLTSIDGRREFFNTLRLLHLDEPHLIEFMKDQGEEKRISKMLSTQTPACIQLYVLECYDLASRDVGSKSDPYMFIQCGDKNYNERDNYQLDESEPKIYKMFQFSGNFPGTAPLHIEAWDYDDLFGDDLIGRTSIDLDDRFFSPDWSALEEKPIEYRQIYHQSSKNSQGVVVCWLEIEPQGKSNKGKTQKVWDIAPEPAKDYQVRLAVFNTEGVPCEDVEGTSDVFIKAYIDDNDKKMTDTHYRCMNGDASFNYRLLFDIKGPRKECMLVIQAWDFDVFKSNDFICEWTLDLKPIFDNVAMTQQPRTLNKKFYDALLKEKMPEGLSLEFRDADESFVATVMRNGKPIKIRLDLRIFPGEDAKANPVGTDRSEPNICPYLNAPEGRIQFSWNPFTMLGQLVSPEFLRKVISIVCVVACCGLIIMCIPMIFSNAVTIIGLQILGFK